MPAWSSAFLIIGVVAAIFGFSGSAGTFTWAAQLLFFLSLIAFTATLFWGRGRAIRT